MASHLISVALDKDYPPEQLEQICQAISLIKGVLSVTTKEVDSDLWLAQERARVDLLKKIILIVNEEN